MLDVYNRYNAGYVRVVHEKQTESNCCFAIEDVNENDESETPTSVDSA